MARTLTSAIQSQITAKRITKNYTFTVGVTNYTDYVLSWTVSFDRNFGSASANFILDNSTGIFSSGAAQEIQVGAVVSLIETFEGDSTQFKRFYGKVEQRTLVKDGSSRTLTLVCLDYISILKQSDIDFIAEADKIEITNETLTPNYLSAPNDMFSQVFDFDNNSIADNPAPILYFTNKSSGESEQQNDGFEISYDAGQIKLGSPLNARDNYDFIARNYWFYPVGLYIEDIIEDLLTTEDGYGRYLFGETTSSAVITNHLKTTYQDEEGAGRLDYLIPNSTSSTITIRHTVSVAITAGVTSITLDSTSGLPTSGSASIAGDIFTWTGVSGNQLTGIPASGSNALTAHPINAILEYEATYAAGQVWYLTYSNLTSTLVAGNFTIPGGTFNYFDARFGRIILTSAISTSAIVRCNYNYEFKTLQATGVELNKISFRSREVENRYEALKKLRDYLAPNYIIFTQGDNKIWANYLSQKTTADYTLNLVQNINYMEDEDLYTRVLFYRKNKNPTNIMFSTNVDFVTTGESYVGTADNNVLQFEKTVDGWHYYKTLITDAGYITGDTRTPVVYINGIPIDNKLRQMVALPVQIDERNRTEVETVSSKKGTDVTTRTYYYYKLIFPHFNIEPTQDIILYNAVGTQVMTISAGDGNMNYGTGTYVVPGDQENTTIETISTATYWVRYSTRMLDIDYVNVRFKISEQLIPIPDQVTVKADYNYYTVFTPQSGTGAVIDGRWDTQVQTAFYAQPPTGYNYAIVDLGSIRNITAMDVVAGFYTPDGIRKYDIGMRVTFNYSLDNVSYFPISSDLYNIEFNGGESKSFDEEQLGIDFQARYLKLVLEDVKKIDFGDNGLYPVVFTEFSCYEDIILKSEAKLVPTCLLAATMSPGNTTVTVNSTVYFTDPSSGQTETAYVGGNSFTYTGLTATTFTGCTVTSSGSINDPVYQDVETDTTLYDDDLLLQRLGDRVYKSVNIDDKLLYTQEQLDSVAKYYLKEFYKDHTKLSVNVMYAPYLKVGQTVALTDSYNNISNVNYFIEQVTDNDTYYTLTLARYPA